MSTSTVESIIDGLITDVGSVLTASLPAVFGLLGVLIGLFFVWRVVRSKVGGPKK